MNTLLSSGFSVKNLKTSLLLFGLLGAGAAVVHAAVPNATVSNKTYTPGTTATEAADQTIATSGTVQVQSGAHATFSAGTKITLSPGFTAQAGSTFNTALVGGPPDSNSDGIPDYWLIQYGYSTNTPATQLDANGSGQTLLQDYIAGINPLPTTISYEVRYDLNQRNQVTALKDSANAVLATYSYNVDTTRQSRWLKNNTQADYAYDGAGRLITLNNYVAADSSGIQKQEYGYDLRDRRVWTQRDGNLGDTYSYQADSELIDFKLNASNPRGTPSGWTQEVAYAYDAMGNRTSVTDNGAVTNYGVDHANQYTSVSGATIQYGDGRGNVTQWNVWTYTYDADNRMLSATKAGTAVTFAYDPVGRLAKRTTNGQVEFFCYDGAEQIVRVDQNGSLLSSSIWGPNPDEVLIDTTPQNGNRYFHSDIQGTTQAVTNDGHQILERYRYDPYGNTSFYDANWIQRSDTVYNVRFLYTGQERMSVMGGIYNYKNRFYTTELGRFLQSDPKRLGASDLNLYRYVFNDPLNNTDPDGQFALIGAALGAGIDLGVQLYLNGGDIHKVNWIQTGVSAAIGATGVGLGNVVANGVKAIAWTGAKAVTARIVANAAGSAIVSATGKAVQNKLEGKDTMDGVGRAAKLGGLFGGGGAIAGEALGTVANAANKGGLANASLPTKLMASSAIAGTSNVVDVAKAGQQGIVNAVTNTAANVVANATPVADIPLRTDGRH